MSVNLIEIKLVKSHQKLIVQYKAPLKVPKCS